MSHLMYPITLSEMKDLTCATILKLVLSFIGVAGQQQSTPGPVDRPRGWDGA